MSDDDGVPVLDPPEPLIRLLESRPAPSATPEFTGPSRGWPPQIDGVENRPRLDSTFPEDDLNGPRGKHIWLIGFQRGATVASRSQLGLPA
jgi:hypothetical protein